MNDLILAIAFSVTVLLWVITDHVKEKKFAAEREQWMSERKDLLDRIQAPSFAEYTNKVVKEKRLGQPQEEEEQVDPYIA